MKAVVAGLEASIAPPKGDPDMPAGYGFEGGVRGKYRRRVRGGGRVAILEPEVARARPCSRSVNGALGEHAGMLRRLTKKSK